MPTSVVIVLLALAALLLPLLPGESSRDLLQTGVQVACLGVAWHSLRRRRELVVAGWGLLLLAVALLTVGDLLAAVERQLWHLQGRPTPSNLLALGGYLMLGLAAVQLDRTRSRGRRLPGRIEAAIFATGLLTPVLVFVLIPIVQRADMPVLARAVTITYALADLVVVAVIARLVLADGDPSRSVGYLSAALFASLAGDVWWWQSTDVAPQAAVRVLWLAGYVLFAAGIAHPSLATFTADGGGAADAPRHRRVWLMGLGQGMPAVALLGVWLLDLTASLLVIAVGGLVVSVLVSARMNGLLDRISEQSSKLARLARSDDLTGLHNRRSWNFELARACRTASAERRPLSVALLDLDHFKRYNDSYGHPAGDRLLRAASEAWQSVLRPGEVLARYGGEEFAVLLPGVPLDEAVQRIDALRLRTPGNQSVSAGVTLWSDGEDPAQAVADADTALYEAKRAGRNRVVPFRPTAAQHESALPDAMRTVVQPIVRMHDLAVVAYEALTRFAPSADVEAVFDQAHQDGYGDLLESAAILSALRLPERPEEVDVFVNVSERALRSSHFWRLMPARLDGVVVGLHHQRVGTDDSTAQRMQRMLERFRDRGAQICLDGLVASEQDLERVVSLRPDLVKVDRSLVRECDTRPEQVRRIERLLAVARSHHVVVCAEGVERVQELLTLRGLGVDFVQGYLLGHPEPHWIEPLQPAARIGSLPDVSGR